MHRPVKSLVSFRVWLNKPNPWHEASYALNCASFLFTPDLPGYKTGNFFPYHLRNGGSPNYCTQSDTDIDTFLKIEDCEGEFYIPANVACIYSSNLWPISPILSFKWVVETCHIMVGSSVCVKLTLALNIPLRHKGLSG